MNSLERFCKQLGLQGGTIHQVAEKLGIDIEQVLAADFVKTPGWAANIKKPVLISPEGDRAECAIYSFWSASNLLILGWKWGL